jgi:hypothetical protein
VLFGVIADADVVEGLAVVPQNLVGHADDAEVERVADVVVRVGRVLRRRVRAKPADDLELPAAEMVRDLADQRDQARIRRVRLAARAPHHALERLLGGGREVPAAARDADDEVFVRREARGVDDARRLRTHRVGRSGGPLFHPPRPRLPCPHFGRRDARNDERLADLEVAWCRGGGSRRRSPSRSRGTDARWRRSCDPARPRAARPPPRPHSRAAHKGSRRTRGRGRSSWQPLSASGTST